MHKRMALVLAVAIFVFYGVRMVAAFSENLVTVSIVAHGELKKEKSYFQQGYQVLDAYGRDAHFGLVFVASALRSPRIMNMANVVAISDIACRTLPQARTLGFFGGGGTFKTLGAIGGFFLRSIGAGMLGSVARMCVA